MLRGMPVTALHVVTLTLNRVRVITLHVVGLDAVLDGHDGGQGPQVRPEEQIQ